MTLPRGGNRINVNPGDLGLPDDRLLYVWRAMEGELAAITPEDVRRDFDRVHKD